MNNDVIISIVGGVAHLDSKPNDIRVIIRDYDTPQIFEVDTKEDEDEGEYQETIYD